MRNPYITGPYVCGRKYYGRSDLVDYLLHGGSNACWVVANRRMGKTSLLRQIEALALEEGHVVPFFWDMQGSDSWIRLSHYLMDAVCDSPDRLAQLGLNPALLPASDAVALLATLRKAARKASKGLLLLCDETEVVVRIAQRAPKSMQRLHRELTAGAEVHVVAASTQGIYQLHDVCRDWTTSPFLAGFDMSQTLGNLTPASAHALITQAQEAEQVRAEPEVIEAICEHTNNHPYLVQLLCARLFQKEGWLRPVTPEDLEVDATLRGFFRIDLDALTQAEREILRAVQAAEVIDEPRLLGTARGKEAELRRQIHNLERLGFLRRVYGQVAIGNQFLANWLAIEPAALDGTPVKVSDGALKTALASRQAQEIDYLVDRLNARRTRLVKLESLRAHHLLDVPPQVLVEIEHLQGQIRHLRRMLGDVQLPVNP